MRTWVLGLVLLSISFTSFATDKVAFTLVGRDECHARLVKRYTDSVQFEVRQWKLSRLVRYGDVELTGDSEGMGGWMRKAFRNYVGIPLVGNQVFQTNNHEAVLGLSESAQFPFAGIEFNRIEAGGDSTVLEIKLLARRDRKVQIETASGPVERVLPTVIDWYGVGRLEQGEWSDIGGNRPYRIRLDDTVCDSYNRTFDGPALQVPGLGLNQFCTWLKSMPHLAAAKSVGLSSEVQKGYFEGAGNGALKFVSPSAEAKLLLSSDP